MVFMSFQASKRRRIMRLSGITGLLYLGLILSLVIATVWTGVSTYMHTDILKPRQVACYIQKLNQALLLRPNKVKLPILMYHYVEYVQDKNDRKRQLMNIEPHVFEQHLKELTAAGYQTVLTRDMPRILTGKADVCVKAVVLSFDDGYADFYTDVFPLLKKYNARATVYVIADYIGKPGFLTETQIREMLDDGSVEVGSHTLDHFYLKRAVRTEQKRQIIESKRMLEDMFHVPVETFAYPFGAYDEHSIQYVKEASYSAAVTVESGAYLSSGDIYELPRIRPEKLEGNIADALAAYEK